MTLWKHNQHEQIFLKTSSFLGSHREQPSSIAAALPLFLAGAMQSLCVLWNAAPLSGQCLAANQSPVHFDAPKLCFIMSVRWLSDCQVLRDDIHPPPPRLGRPSTNWLRPPSSGFFYLQSGEIIFPQATIMTNCYFGLAFDCY